MLFSAPKEQTSEWEYFRLFWPVFFAETICSVVVSCGVWWAKSCTQPHLAALTLGRARPKRRGLMAQTFTFHPVFMLHVVALHVVIVDGFDEQLEVALKAQKNINSG